MFQYLNCMSVPTSPVSSSVNRLQCVPTNINAASSPLSSPSHHSVSPLRVPNNHSLTPLSSPDRSATLSASKYSTDETLYDQSRSAVLPDAYYTVDRTNIQSTPPVRRSRLQQQAGDVVCTLTFNTPTRPNKHQQQKHDSSTKVFNTDVIMAINNCVTSFFDIDNGYNSSDSTDSGYNEDYKQTTSNHHITQQKPSGAVRDCLIYSLKSRNSNKTKPVPFGHSKQTKLVKSGHSKQTKPVQYTTHLTLAVL